MALFVLAVMPASQRLSLDLRSQALQVRQEDEEHPSLAPLKGSMRSEFQACQLDVDGDVGDYPEYLTWAGPQ